MLSSVCSYLHRNTSTSLDRRTSRPNTTDTADTAEAAASEKSATTLNDSTKSKNQNEPPNLKPTIRNRTNLSPSTKKPSTHSASCRHKPSEQSQTAPTPQPPPSHPPPTLHSTITHHLHSGRNDYSLRILSMHLAFSLEYAAQLADMCSDNITMIREMIDMWRELADFALYRRMSAVDQVRFRGTVRQLVKAVERIVVSMERGEEIRRRVFTEGVGLFPAVGEGSG